MSVDKGVKLASCGEHWKAYFYDQAGKRRCRNIGRKDAMSRRLALRACAELAEELAKEPGRRDAGRAPELGAWLARYLAMRTDIGERSLAKQETVAARLKACFGEAARLDEITRARANDFATWCRALKKADGKTPLADFTVWGYMLIAREMFGHAKRENAVALNPFDQMKIATPQVEKEWPYVTPAEADQIITAAPSHGWKCLIALARLGGLRRGEGLRLTWRDVDWDARTVTVRPPGNKRTTKARLRTVPMQPRLYVVLRAAYDAAAEKATMVCDIRPNNIEREMERIILAAKLTPWADKPLHTLRKNLETDWLAEHPVLDVVRWLGNSPDVAAKHYHQTRPEAMAKVTGGVNETEQLRRRILELEAQLQTQKASA